jgi:bacterioferritin-associated ferredoxin
MECDARLFAARAVDRFSKACCGKCVELANAWMKAREDAPKQPNSSKLMRSEEL